MAQHAREGARHMTQAAEGARRTTQEAVDSVKRATQEADEGMQRATKEATDGAQRLMHAGIEGTERVTQEIAGQGNRSMRVAAEIYSDAAHETGEDLQAIATLSTIAAGGLNEWRQAWINWFNRSLGTTARASRQLLHCTSIEEIADLQRSFLKESFGNLLEGSAQMLRISGRVSEDALRPLEDRVLISAANRSSTSDDKRLGQPDLNSRATRCNQEGGTRIPMIAAQ